MMNCCLGGGTLHHPVCHLIHVFRFTLIRSSHLLYQTIPQKLSSVPQSCVISTLEYKSLLGLPLSRSDYPNVQFWFRERWLSRSYGNSAGSQGDKPSPRGKLKSQEPPGVDVLLCYVEDEHGIPVDGHHANEMRNFAWAFWSQLADASKALRYWEEAVLEVSSQY